MRAIKFRAWDGKNMHQVGEIAWTVGGLRWYGPGFGSGCVEESGFPLMQYTGLKDKNGAEIYEGDIVRMTYSQGSVKIGCIFYDNNKAGFCLMTGSTIYTIIRKGAEFNPWTEVIGNIYENPELLK